MSNRPITMVIFGILIISVLMYAQEVNQTPMVRRVQQSSRALLYTVGEPPQLLLEQFGETRVFDDLIDATEFTISHNCQYIITTGNLDGAAFIRLIDLKRGERDKVLFAANYFRDEGIERFLAPSFAPDNTTFAVVGVKADGSSVLYMTNGDDLVIPVYAWENDVVIETRWITTSTAVVEYGPDLTGPYSYLQISIGKHAIKTTGHSYRSLPSSEHDVFDNKPIGAHRVLSCRPAFTEALLRATATN